MIDYCIMAALYPCYREEGLGARHIVLVKTPPPPPPIKAVVLFLIDPPRLLIKFSCTNTMYNVQYLIDFWARSL